MRQRLKGLANLLAFVAAFVPGLALAADDPSPTPFWESSYFDSESLTKSSARSYVWKLLQTASGVFYVPRWTKPNLDVVLLGVGGVDYKIGESVIIDLARQIGVNVTITNKKEPGRIYDIELFSLDSYEPVAKLNDVYAWFRVSKSETKEDFTQRFNSYDKERRTHVCRTLSRTLEGQRIYGETFYAACFIVTRYLEDPSRDFKLLVSQAFAKSLLTPAKGVGDGIYPSTFSPRFYRFKDGLLPPYDIAALRELYSFHPGEQIAHLEGELEKKMADAVAKELSKARQEYKKSLQ